MVSLTEFYEEVFKMDGVLGSGRSSVLSSSQSSVGSIDSSTSSWFVASGEFVVFYKLGEHNLLKILT